jgi:hypothetical protein
LQEAEKYYAQKYKEGKVIAIIAINVVNARRKLKVTPAPFQRIPNTSNA